MLDEVIRRNLMPPSSQDNRLTQFHAIAKHSLRNGYDVHSTVIYVIVCCRNDLYISFAARLVAAEVFHSWSKDVGYVSILSKNQITFSYRGKAEVVQNEVCAAPRVLIHHFFVVTDPVGFSQASPYAFW